MPLRSINQLEEAHQTIRNLPLAPGTQIAHCVIHPELTIWGLIIGCDHALHERWIILGTPNPRRTFLCIWNTVSWFSSEQSSVCGIPFYYNCACQDSDSAGLESCNAIILDQVSAYKRSFAGVSKESPNNSLKSWVSKNRIHVLFTHYLLLAYNQLYSPIISISTDLWFILRTEWLLLENSSWHTRPLSHLGAILL